MTNISFTRSNSDPTDTPPQYDPRDGFGISIHVNTHSQRVFLGLRRIGDKKWGRLRNDTNINASGDPTGNFVLNFPIVTTSSDVPDFVPQFSPSQGRLHIHIAYISDEYYNLCLGTRVNTEGDFSSNWVIYETDGIID